MSSNWLDAEYIERSPGGTCDDPDFLDAYTTEKSVQTFPWAVSYCGQRQLLVSYDEMILFDFREDDAWDKWHTHRERRKRKEQQKLTHVLSALLWAGVAYWITSRLLMR